MSIIEGSDGRLYAASYGNNQSGAGTVFSLNRDGSNRTILRSFSFTTGSTAYGPYGRLYRSPSGIVYGTTEYTITGNAYGVVFALSESPSTKLKLDGGNILIGSPGQGMILRSPNGTTCVKIGIDNIGAMVLTPMTCP